MSRSMFVVRPGSLTTVQDAGRPGFGQLAVPPSGALDRPALDLANRLVGNGPGAAALETTADGVSVRFDADTWVAVTGAPASITVDRRPAAYAEPVWVSAGRTIDIGRPVAGVRSYLAVAGGLQPPPVLGSRSTDLLSGLGPAPLRAGDMLLLGPQPAEAPGSVDGVTGPSAATMTLALVVWLGPRPDWLGEAEVERLGGLTYQVASSSNRIALRLDGPALQLAGRGELASEGIVTGAVQVPPDGRPLIFLADHPTTGGYPVIGVVDPAGLPGCAQARPGSVVRLLARNVRPAD